MSSIVGWLIAALCVAFFVIFLVASCFVAVLSLRHPPTAGGQ
jgi:hypothetical protein